METKRRRQLLQKRRERTKHSCSIFMIDLHYLGALLCRTLNEQVTLNCHVSSIQTIDLERCEPMAFDVEQIGLACDRSCVTVGAPF